jgi:hypothetical protein
MGDLEMSVYRRLARSKKGMSTIFGGLFFVILILMGFNVMLWGFVQLDAYNSTISRMSQRDQQAVSENLVPVNSTCTSSCVTGSGTMSIIVDNLGGYSVAVSNVYIFNTNTTGACEPTPCILTPTGTTGNIPAGAVNFLVRVSPSVAILPSNSYHISLATSRGRLFNLYYPWRFSSNIIINNGNGGNFVTNIGPLAIYFDYKSFNFTQGSSGTCSGVAPNPSCPAFCMPSGPVILYIRVANTSNSTVTILTQTGLEAQAYGVNGFGQFAQGWLLDKNSVNPSTESAYSYAGNPYVLPPQPPTGPTQANFAILKIGASSPGGTGAITWSNAGRTWITFIGIYYLFNGQPQGQTVPFMDFYTNYPNCIN